VPFVEVCKLYVMRSVLVVDCLFPTMLTDDEVDFEEQRTVS